MTIRRALFWSGSAVTVWVVVVVIMRVFGNEGPRVTMQILNETNIDGKLYRMVLVSNATRQALTCFPDAHSERFTGWYFGPPSRVCSLGGYESQLVSLPVQTNGPVSVTLVAAPILRGWERWLDSAKVRLGLRPKRGFKLEAKAE